ncbi:jasmonate-induced oxygenase 4 [Salvia divinorum]|uniref:Jasmonate-induced oxygenase 4 n=1 Tax=Salvia divinorum TaxID=28513 RepID=A0ABD1IDH8_SALDI
MEAVGTQIRVQSLVGEEAVPPQYVQPLETRTQRVVGCRDDNDEPSLPVIDLSDNGDSVPEQLGRACRDWGAFHVISHGVPVELLREMRRLSRSFFEDCAMDQKLSYACDPTSPASEGYGSRMLVASNDTVLDWRDYFDHHTLPLSRRDPSKWPHFSPNYRKVVAEYSDQMNALAEKLLCLISESLGLPASCIKDAIGEFYQNITVSYYPPCPQPELTLGLQSHSDMGGVTLLIQDDVGGLEVLKDGKWVLVNPLSDAILVILADQTEVITNGQYKSSVHRAITNAKKARLSVATFHDPGKTKTVSPALKPPKYRPVMYGDYVSSWYTKGPEGKRNIDALLLQ